MKTIPWTDRIRQGTRVRVKSFDAVVLNSCPDRTRNVYGCRMTIKDPYMGESFWTVIPVELVELADEN